MRRYLGTHYRMLSNQQAYLTFVDLNDFRLFPRILSIAEVCGCSPPSSFCPGHPPPLFSLLGILAGGLHELCIPGLKLGCGQNA